MFSLVILYGNIIVKTKKYNPTSFVFDSSCNQNIDEGFVVNNAVDVQKMVQNIKVNNPIFIFDRQEIGEAVNCLDKLFR